MKKTRRWIKPLILIPRSFENCFAYGEQIARLWKLYEKKKKETKHG